VGSPINKDNEKLQKQITQLREEGGQLRGKMTDKSAEKQIASLNAKKTRLLDSLKTANPLLWRTASLLLFPDYSTEVKGYSGPAEFYGKEFFRYANLSDPGYEGFAFIFDAFSQYAGIMTNMRASKQEFNQWADLQLQKIPKNTKNYRMALGGIVTGLKSSSNPLYPEYVKQYMDLYKNDSNGEIAQMDYEMKRSGTSTPGFEAPDLVGMTPDSQSYALSKLRGKVVLIDFWASWCGPCRRENPNVVKNYNKYKDKGFDILGVSLDREPGAWKKAISDDGLPWHHISDLKGWQSSHAALYSVTSIPQTVLVDKEGKIIARNIRGEQLGDKLKEILGE
jgi:thiol-disulfide isomerase/thioredoxin